MGGAIIINGIDLLDRKTDIYGLRRRMFIIFQSFNLFSHLI